MTTREAGVIVTGGTAADVGRASTKNHQEVSMLLMKMAAVSIF